jgi:hypothetical protein
VNEEVSFFLDTGSPTEWFTRPNRVTCLGKYTQVK